MTLTSKSLAAIVLAILFGGILFSSGMGWWQTESTKQAATFREGEFAGQPNPADIRGSYTFGDIENNFGVPAAILTQVFGVPSDNSSTFEVKALETIYADTEFEIGTSSVRFFVALFTGLPYEIAGDIYLPERAVEILKSQVTLNTDQIVYLDSHAILLERPGAAQEALEPVSVILMENSSEEDPHTETDSTDRTLKGKTTFQEVLDWGVPQGTIETVIGGPLPSLLTKVKDYCTEQGLTFEEIRPAIQAEIDKVAP
jgi:hypothetical protein